MTNWCLNDRAGHRFVFPRFFFASNAQVRIWTKRGVNTLGDLYWGHDRAIWNNPGDMAILYDAQDHPVSTFTYTGKQ
jgi:hypothetical protein